eukprot:gene6205-6843_t
MLENGIEVLLFVWYLIFAFTALVFEPLYYFGCNWNGLTCTLAHNSPLLEIIRQIWFIYAHYDPIFYDMPLWLRILCGIEVFLFGPLYVLTAWGLYKKTPWLNFVALPFSGALIYSTIVYFAMEVLEEVEGTNLLVVFLVNLPWTIIPILLLYRLYQIDKKDQPNRKAEMAKNN